MLKLATKLQVIFIIIFNIIFHVILKIISVFIVGMLIGESDSSIKYMVFIESIFVLAHILLNLFIYKNERVFKSKEEFIVVILVSIIVIVGLYYFNYLPQFGSG